MRVQDSFQGLGLGFRVIPGLGFRAIRLFGRMGFTRTLSNSPFEGEGYRSKEPETRRFFRVYVGPDCNLRGTELTLSSRLRLLVFEAADCLFFLEGGVGGFTRTSGLWAALRLLRSRLRFVVYTTHEPE